MKRTALLSPVILLAACSAGPAYVRPSLDLPTRFTAGAAPVDGTTPAAAIPVQWWQAFGSPPLDALVTAALAGNPTLEAARASLRAAQAAVQAERAAYWPTLAAGVSAQRARVPDALASPAASGADYYSVATAQLSVAYSPDVFGATRRAVESAEAQAEVQRFEREATALTLTTNVVAAAIAEATLRAQREATLAIVAAQRDVLLGERRQLALGDMAAADVDAQAAALATTEASLPPIEKQLALQRILLTTLAGRYPTDEIEARFDLASLHLPAALPLTLPSTLVERRPDVRAAEAQLQAASAQIGVAAAARLPSFSLGGTGAGVSAAALPALFTPASVFWTLTAGVAQPIFDGGALRDREAAARATFDATAAQYRATVLGAFSDVANALEAIAADARALDASVAAEHAVNANIARTRRQVALGDASPLALRVAEQNQQQAALARIQAEAARLGDAAALFQALGGGGWPGDEDAAGTRTSAATVESDAARR